MNPTYELISEQILNSSQASVIFYNIPQIFKDLIITFNARSANTSASIADNVRVRFNDFSSDTNHTARYVYASGSTTSAGTDTFARFGYANSNLTTANCFANNEVYIPNYTSSTTKIFTSTSVIETVAAASDMTFSSGSYNSTNPITSMILYTGSGSNFMSGTSFQLYGIKGADDGDRGFFGPAMTGGNEVFTTGNGYKVHVFKNSGTLNVTAPGEIEYLVIAGGGGGGASFAGGGGAGGYRSSVAGESSGGGTITESKKLISPGSYSVIVGAGGTGGSTLNVSPYTNTVATAGNQSSFIDIVSVGGGRSPYVQYADNPEQAAGGSGAGGNGASNSTRRGGYGVSGQGTNGGNGIDGGISTTFTGGGGGAGTSGGNAVGTVSGNGGNGLASSITGTSITRAGGGGGGLGNTGTPGTGGSGGGGNASASSAAAAGSGTINTGSGGGGGSYFGNLHGSGGNGGSGIVIIRYRI